MPFTPAHHVGVSRSTRRGATCSIRSSRASKANLRLRNPPMMAGAKARTELFGQGAGFRPRRRRRRTHEGAQSRPAAPVPTQIIPMSMLLDHRTPGTIVVPWPPSKQLSPLHSRETILRKGRSSFHRHSVFEGSRFAARSPVLSSSTVRRKGSLQPADLLLLIFLFGYSVSRCYRKLRNFSGVC